MVRGYIADSHVLAPPEERTQTQPVDTAKYEPSKPVQKRVGRPSQAAEHAEIRPAIVVCSALSVQRGEHEITSWTEDSIDVVQDLTPAFEIHRVDAVVCEGDKVDAAIAEVQPARVHFQKLDIRKAMASDVYHSGAIVDPAIISAERQHERSGSATTDADIQNSTPPYCSSYELKGSVFAWFKPTGCSPVLTKHPFGCVSASVDPVEFGGVRPGHDDTCSRCAALIDALLAQFAFCRSSTFARFAARGGYGCSGFGCYSPPRRGRARHIHVRFPKDRHCSGQMFWPPLTQYGRRPTNWR